MTGSEHLRAILSDHLTRARVEERSVKASLGRFETDRLLVSIGRRSMLPGPRTRLERLLSDLGAPACNDLAPLWPNATTLHFGAEGATRKCYLEFGEDPPAPGVVFHAIKWRDGLTRTDRYLDRAADAMSTIKATVPDGASRDAIQAMMTRSAKSDPARQGFLLEVVGQGDARRSVDVNLAHCRLTVGETAEILEPALLESGGSDGVDWLAEHRDERLGHFAAGRNADGSAFVTIYFGARSV